MKQTHAKIRLGSTAIAAVLALSSTPAFAQDSTTAVEEPVTSTTTPPASDPLAPEPETTAEPAAATTTSKLTTTKPAAKPVKRTTVARATTTARPAPRAATAPLDVVSADPVPSPVALPEAAVPEMAAIEEPTVPVAADPAPATTAGVPDEALPIAGAGLGALALAGLGMAVRRRRRREHDEADETYVDEPTLVEPFHEPRPPVRPAPETAPVAAAPTAAVTGPASDLPEGFDLSRFGPHVQAAYRGPSENNPSLSLKKRLKAARAMDQQDRGNGVTRQAPPASSPIASTPADKPLMGQFGQVKVNFGQPKTEPAFHY